MDVVEVVDGGLFVHEAIEVDHLSVRTLYPVHEQREFGVFGRFEVVLDPDGGHQGIGFEDGPSAEDEFNAHDAEGGVGLHDAHGEVAGHFLGEATDAVESGVDHVAHVGELGSFCELAKIGVVEVVVAPHVVIFAVFDKADIPEKGLECVDVFEVVEVENFFHCGDVNFLLVN